MIFAKELQDETTRNEFKEEVRNECARCGIIKDIAVPMPPPDADINDTPGRIYVHFQDEFSAHMAKEMLQGRVFDGNTVFVSLISDIECVAILSICLNVSHEHLIVNMQI